MYKILLTVFLAIITTACGGPRYVDYFPYFDDGTPKPRVALMPVIDSTQNDLSWCFDEEIYQGISYEFMNSGKFYIVSPAEIGSAWQQASEADLLSSDPSCLAGFRNTDFVVILELLDRTVAPCGEGIDGINRTLTTNVRIKVIDIRCQTPKVVLYEVFKSSYLSTTSHGDVDGNGVCWGEAGYGKTCCGQAHLRLIRSLSQRLEETIWRVK